MLNIKTIEFYRELRINNNKEWFDRNRDRYEEVKKDSQRLVNELLLNMSRFDPALEYLQAKDCIFRINRDIRFSKDKTPYKTHLGIFITPFGKKSGYAGYYVHLDEKEGSFAGGGIYMPDGDILKKIRKEISAFYEDLEKIVNSDSFKKTFGGLDIDNKIMLVRPPKGYNMDDPAIEFLKLRSFTATKDLPAEILTDPAGINKLVDIFKTIKPFNSFLNRALEL